MSSGNLENDHGRILDNIKFKRVLITGITGLLGSWLAEELMKKNVEVLGVALDNEKDDLLISKKIYSNLDIQYFDIANEEMVSNYFKNYNFDIVIHLAAQTQVIDADKNPLNTFNSNIKGTWNILDACLRKDTPVVVASSDKAYGVSEDLPYLETHPLNGIYPYEISKSITDLLVKSYFHTYDLNVTSLRCGNIYGGGDLNWDRLIPGLCKWLINKDTPILRTDGSFKRDWVYVEDVAYAYMMTASSLYDNPKSVALSYNFASEDYKTVMDVYEEISNQIAGKFIEPIFQINSKNEIPDQYLDSTKIYNDLGIKSNFLFSQGIKNTVTWYDNYFLKYLS